MVADLCGTACPVPDDRFILGAVFARGGSKGVPRKCLRTVGGRTLLEIAVGHAQAVERIDAVVVSTDDKEYASVAERAGATVPFLRPADLASDTAAEIDAWRHLISHMENQGERPDVLVTFPATAPLRRPADVDAALDLFFSSGADLVVTGTRAVRNPYFNMVEISEDGWASVALRPSTGVVRRQDAPELWDLTTVAFVADPDYVMETDYLLDGRVAVSPVPRERALDIDDEFDLLVADLVLREGDV